METNWRLRADARIVDIGKRDLAVQLEIGPCQCTAVPAALNENSGLIDDIIISPEEPFAASWHHAILQELSSIVVIFLVVHLRFFALLDARASQAGRTTRELWSPSRVADTWAWDMLGCGHGGNGDGRRASCSAGHARGPAALM